MLKSNGRWLTQSKRRAVVFVSVWKDAGEAQFGATLVQAPPYLNNRSNDMARSPHYSILEYVYRDAANWKIWGRILLHGSITTADLRRIEAKLEGGAFVIPEQIGIDPLTSAHFSSARGISQNDHLWHEFATARAATTEEVPCLSVWGTTAVLLELIDGVGDWNLKSSQHYAAMHSKVVGNMDVSKMSRNRGS